MLAGIWADDSDEEERPSFGGSGKGSKNYTAPVSFISGGIKVGDKTTKQVVDDDGDHHVTVIYCVLYTYCFVFDI